MREMKDSGITFVGNIPDNWKVLKNKRCFELEKDIVGPKFKEYQRIVESYVHFLRQTADKYEKENQRR